MNTSQNATIQQAGPSGAKEDNACLAGLLSDQRIPGGKSQTQAGSRDKPTAAGNTERVKGGPTEKRCLECGETKPLSAFDIRKRGTEWRQSNCKECQNQLRRIRTAKKRASTPRLITEISEFRICHKCGEVRHKSEFYKYSKVTCRYCIIKDIQNKRKLNREHYLSVRKKSERKIRSTPKGKLCRTMSSSIRHALIGEMGKAGRRWENLVGYSVESLKAHLEKLFSDGMTWENYGEWHIDHKIPISAFNFQCPEDLDFKRCWALRNLQPMWAKENRIKHNRLSKPFQPSLGLAVMAQ